MLEKERQQQLSEAQKQQNRLRESIMNFNQELQGGDRSEDEGENLDEDEEEKFYDASAGPLKAHMNNDNE